MSEQRKLFIGTLSVGDRVEIQTRLNDASPVIGTGLVKHKYETGDILVELDGEKPLLGLCNFNSFGICMPFNRQLQIKLTEI